MYTWPFQLYLPTLQRGRIKDLCRTHCSFFRTGLLPLREGGEEQPRHLSDIATGIPSLRGSPTVEPRGSRAAWQPLFR